VSARGQILRALPFRKVERDLRARLNNFTQA
jgi:hypothetical protein